MTESTAAATPKIVTPLNVEEAVRNRYSGAAQAQEAALCCPVDYDAKYLEIIPPEIIERDYGCGDPSKYCLLYTSPSPRDATLSRMPSSA